MAAITDISMVHIALPTRREHKWTGLTEPIGIYILVRVGGDNGEVGWGEAPALKDWGGDYGRYYGESPGTVRHVIERTLAPAVAGCQVANLAELHRRMDEAIKGHPYAKAAVDLAAHDLAGRSLGVPVHTLLGGKLRDSIPVTHSIGLIDIADAVAECRQAVGEVIRTIKIKIGVDPRRDVLKALTHHQGRDSTGMFDALDAALQFSARLYEILPVFKRQAARDLLSRGSRDGGRCTQTSHPGRDGRLCQ